MPSYPWLPRVSSTAAGWIVVIVAFGLGAAMVPTPARDLAVEAEHLGRALPLWSGLPFAGILLSIALFPLLAPRFWHRHFKKVAVAWALVFFAPFFVQYGTLAVFRVLATKAGYNPLTINLTTSDRNPYYPGVKENTICITGDLNTGKLLGAQLVGHRDSEVAKRIDIIASALYNGMSVRDLCDLDLSYSPPLSSPWDPVQKAAMHWTKAVKT